METAWQVDRTKPLPATVDHSRRVALVWHCAQRWFDAWVTWDSATGPVTVLFATPPHTGGDIIDRIDIAVKNGTATAVQPATATATGDMVLVCQERNGPQRKRTNPLAWSASGAVQLPPVGRANHGTGSVGAYSISADAGGVRPRTKWQ